jgi:hypothetical protein
MLQILVLMMSGFSRPEIKICKISEVNLSPSSYLYDAPNTSADFDVMAISRNERNEESKIVSTPAYAWEWSWGQIVTRFLIFLKTINLTTRLVFPM